MKLRHSFRRRDTGYEEARRATLWNARLPHRYPDLIVQAHDVYDVVGAVRLARAEGMRMGICSGGHSWSGNHLREGGMLLDLSRLDEVHIDARALRATAGPGRAGSSLLGLLGKEGLFFPAGHCKGVAIGGYLLQGGFGWHSRALGLGCMSVLGVDLVTADGDLVHASPEENADLYWSARGSGAGFFGVVTRYHLRLHARPKVIGFALQTFPIGMLEEVFRWAHAVGPEVPAAVELQLMMTQQSDALRGPAIEMVAPVFADEPAAALEAVDFMNKSALRGRAARAIPFLPASLDMLYEGVMTHYPDHHRWAVDNMWTHASFDELLPGLLRIARTLPPPPSHMLWLNWAPPPDRPDMAFSMEDSVYIALYGGWKDPDDDARHASWAQDRMGEMAHLASGCQLADENLGQRPARFVSDAHLERLDAIRAARDPQGRFHPWMGRPKVGSR
jgi:FAD/FMN-containing dehydrogenase